MSNRKAAQPAATSRRRCRPGLAGAALALLVMSWTGVPGDVRADTIVLKSGEVLEGSIIDATRNTVIVQPAIGGMRQMPIRDIEEVRIELAQGQRISGQLLSWAEGVYRVRSGDQVIRVSEGDILSRETGEAATGQPRRDLPPRPLGPQTVRMATAPAPSAPEDTAADRAAPPREQMAAQKPQGEDRSLPAGDDQSPGAGRDQSFSASENQSAAADEKQSPGAGDDQGRPVAAKQRSAVGEEQGPAVAAEQRSAAGEEQGPAGDEKQSLAAGEEQGRAIDEKQSPAAGEKQSLAAVGEDQSPATREKQGLAVKASVEPTEPGAERMVFRIELSRPAEETVVLIYGTVEGTAKAGEDFEPQQGMVTLAPGTKSTEVHVPLIEHSPSQGEKRFELFLTADPKVAEVVDRRISATIAGGD